MPHMLSPDIGESSRSRSRQRARTEVSEHRSMWDRLSLQKIGSWLKREEEEPPPSLHEKIGRQSDEGNKENGRPHSSAGHPPSSRGGLLHRRTSSRKVVPGLPRPLTFKRMNSEKRDKLLEVPVPVEQRRAASADRRASTTTKRNLSPPPVTVPSISAPDVLSPQTSETQQKPEPTIGGTQDSNIPAGARQVDYSMDENLDYLSMGDPPPFDLEDAYYERDSQRSASDVDDSQLQDELEAKWILNLSMHFRDMSDREKFFITFAEEPNRWRRVTVSCDYRQLEPDSLEADLKSLHYQRDKSARIYEAIRDSLPDIQFYDTVTNLKLQTSDGRLHVHVTEDVNEIIPYPSLSAVDHLDCKKFTENAVCFDSHISGFVYKVAVNNKSFIKKEIPGPDAVEEFLYEINALSNLQDSKSVIKFEGIIIDEKSDVIKGLLISYAEQGALVDLIYDYKNSDSMPWERREQWARQIVEGLSEIHEAGFVQGDFTLSNIVIDNHDNAKIIDINRRGCPVGWEPPELARLIESGQRISIYIGVKSDLFQLGMVLWALAELHDEPERQDRPLAKTLDRSPVPEYFKNIIRACLSDSPKQRPAARDLLARFPEPSKPQERISNPSDNACHTVRASVSTHRSDKEYIDPATAVGLDDIPNLRQHSRPRSSFSNVNMPSTEYIGSSGSYILPSPHYHRGRSPGVPRSTSGARTSDCSPYPVSRSIMSLDDSELENELASLPASRETRWEQVYVDGDTKLVQRGGGEIDVQDFANQDPKDVCITTPPGELESSFISNKTSEETTPLNLSTVAELQPQLTPPKADRHSDAGSRKSVGNKASFSDRVHQLAQAHDSSPPSNSVRANSHIPDSTTLADLENEIALDSSIASSVTLSRTDTGFSNIDRGPERPRRAPTGFSIAHGFHSPPHQDSGFDEGPSEERVSYESERIRQSLEMSMKDIKRATEEEECVNERLWDEKDGTMIGEGVRGDQLVIKPDPAAPFNPTTIAPMTTTAVPATEESKGININNTEDKALEEKTSNTTIRPPSILIPEFHHGVPKAVEAVDTNSSAAMQATGSSHQQAASGPESHMTNHHRSFT